MNMTFRHLAIAASMLGFSAVALAEDIEIYMTPSQPASSEPMVMFSLDYRPNLGSAVEDYTDFFAAQLELGVNDPDLPDGAWSFFDVLRLSLKVVFQDLSGVKVGLMLNHNNQNNCAGPRDTSCSNGGYIAMGFESLSVGDTTGAKARFQGILQSMPVPGGNLSHSNQGAELYFEFFRYLTGQGVYNGLNGWTDYGTDNTQNLDQDGAGHAWDTGIIDFAGPGDGTYITPLGAASDCTRIFAINFMFFVTNQETDSDNAIQATQALGGMGGINYPNSASLKYPAVVRYLYDANLGDGTYGTVPNVDGQQNVVSYFVVDPAFINNTTRAYAQAGGTQQPLAFSEDPQELIDTLNNIFQQILSVSTTFVAASVPVNVFNRSEIVDNVYIALFQADPDGNPRWSGSLKKLKILEQDNTVRLVDVLGADAVAPDGRVNFSALTFWTDAAALPDPDPNLNEVAGRDGRSVARGGGGQKIPGYITGGPGDSNGVGNRNLFTEKFDELGNLILLPLNAIESTADELRGDIAFIGAPGTAITSTGVASATEMVNMVRWMRGMDVDDLDLDLSTTDARPWILGDPLHSRPLPINYGARGGHTVTNPDIRIVMGSNDGYLRMFRNTDTSGVDIGQEVWGFMPREVMPKMASLRVNEPFAAGTPPHPYTVDGAPVVLVEDLAGDGTISGTDRVLMFFGLRRGGRAYYALNITDPDNPEMLWRITADDTDYAELGLSYSTPQIGRVRIKVGEDADGNPINETIPILIFTGGYDTNKDARGAVGTGDTIGNAVFVVNANDGALIWKAVQGNGAATSSVYQHPDMLDSFPSESTVVDTSGDGFVDRVYVGDSGGTVWRMDLGGTITENWTASVIAFIGRHFDGSTTEHDRRFFHAPDLVLARDDIGAFDAVIIGTGNRENPLDRLQVPVTENFFYMIKDRRTQSGPVPIGHVAYDHDSFGDVTDNCLQLDTCVTPPDLTNGWRLQLLESLGEKNLALPFTIAGTIFFTTYLPPGDTEAATCGPSEGGGVLYAVSLDDARSVINFDTTDDDPDAPGEATTTADRSRALRSGGIPAEVVALPPNRILLPDLSTETIPGSMRWRTFWYENENPDS